MPLSFQESIRGRMRSTLNLYELFNMRHYMDIQKDVLINVSHHFGISDFRQFASSELGQHAMKMYRNILLRKYGEDPEKPMNPNTDKDPGFFGNDPYSKKKLIDDITSEIIISYKEKQNV